MSKQQGAGFGSRRHDRRRDEWAASLKSRIISGEITISRRFSASHATSFREEKEEEDDSTIDNKSSRSNLTISSTVSSPGYFFKDEIDPSTHSFNTTLRELQGRRRESRRREEGLVLNSKWQEAEKYISNPLSGEVPVECLSGRSFRSEQLTTPRRRISMSAPLYYPPKLHSGSIHKQPLAIPISEMKNGDEGSESSSNNTPQPSCNHSLTSSCSPLSSQDRPIKRNQHPTTPSPAKVKYDVEKREEIKGESRKEEEEMRKEETAVEAEERGRRRQGGCLSWKGFMWMRKRQRDKGKVGSMKNRNSHPMGIFLCPINEW